MENLKNHQHQISDINQITKQYFFELYGTFQLYEGSEVGVIGAKNCTQMAQEIYTLLTSKGYESAIIGGSYNNIKNNHLANYVCIGEKKYLIDPTLFIDSAIELPDNASSYTQYESPQMTGYTSFTNKYYNTNGQYSRLRMKNSKVEKIGHYDHVVDTPDKLISIVINQESRDKLRLRKMYKTSDGLIVCAKLTFDSKENGYVVYAIGEESEKISIPDLLRGKYDKQLHNSFGLTKEGIQMIPHTISNFVAIKALDSR